MNTKKIMLLGFMIIAVGFTSIHSAYAAPERIQISNSERKMKEKAAKQVFKNINLGAIQDPEARKAITEIAKVLELA